MSFRSSAIGLAKRAMPGRARFRLGAAAASALVAGAVALAAPATASASSVTAAGHTTPNWSVHLLPLNAMPVGTVVAIQPEVMAVQWRAGAMIRL